MYLEKYIHEKTREKERGKSSESRSSALFTIHSDVIQLLILSKTKGGKP